jgi:F-type H+-transporting ATPase subunit b
LKYSISDLNLSATTIRISWLPTLFAKNAKRVGLGALSGVFLTALIAGVVVAPFGLAAQSAPSDSASAATVGQAAPQAPAPVSSEAAKPEADETAAFRLEGPLVKASAKALNLSVETTARLFEIINFAIIVLALGIPLVRFLPKVFRRRSQTVLANIEAARKETESANARLSAIEAKLSGLDAEIAQIRSQVEQESLNDEARIKAAIVEESAHIVASAEQEIGVAALHATQGLKNFAAELAIEQAAKQLVLTPETDKALIAEFISGVKGGQN